MASPQVAQRVSLSFLQQYSAVGPCCPALIPTCVSIQLLSGCPAGGWGGVLRLLGHICVGHSIGMFLKGFMSSQSEAYVRYFEKKGGKY